MIKNSLLSSKAPNLNNVQNANFGFKDQQDAMQWFADVEQTFVMIAEEFPAHMEVAAKDDENYFYSICF
jgi:hypothetical protein